MNILVFFKIKINIIEESDDYEESPKLVKKRKSTARASKMINKKLALNI